MLYIAVFSLMIFLSTACNDKKQPDVSGINTSKTKLEALPRHLEDIKTPDDAIKALKDGNQRFMNGQFEHIHIKRIGADSEDDPEPFVGIITCADCKIPPEILFDQDKKFVMIMKTPANVEDEDVLSQLNSAVEQQGLKVIVVLGHNDCAAIKSVLGKEHQFEDTGKLATLITQAMPPVGDTVNAVNVTAKKNVQLTIQRIVAKSPLIGSAIKDNKLKMFGAFYDVKTGELIYDGDL
jgi:carbonic anhydrase